MSAPCPVDGGPGGRPAAAWSGAASASASAPVSGSPGRGGPAAVAALAMPKSSSLGRSVALQSVEDHDVGQLDVAVDDAQLVRAVYDLAQPLEQRGQQRRRHGPAPGQQVVEGGAAHVLHRDPQQAVGLGPERVDVGGVRVVEPRRQLGLAQEPLDPQRGGLHVGTHDLDDRAAAELLLLGAEHVGRAAPTQRRDHHVLAEPAAEERALVRAARGWGAGSPGQGRRRAISHAHGRVGQRLGLGRGARPAGLRIEAAVAASGVVVARLHRPSLRRAAQPVWSRRRIPGPVSALAMAARVGGAWSMISRPRPWRTPC